MSAARMPGRGAVHFGAACIAFAVVVLVALAAAIVQVILGDHP